MNEKAWRTIIVNPGDTLTLSDEQLVVTRDEVATVVPIGQIARLMITSTRGSMSLPLVESLMKQNTAIIFCDGNRIPVGELFPIVTHYESAGKILDQTKWTNRKKNAAWNRIVRMKIENQYRLLKMKECSAPDILRKYAGSVKDGDADNREAMAARVYFPLLFGVDFVRFAEDNNNAALNYGYTILRNAFVRGIVSYGYQPALGIHHCSRQNRYNLASDLMEPFRPFVDRIVYENNDRELDGEYKKELMGILNTTCSYGNKKIELDNAIECFILDVMKFMEQPREVLKEISFD